MNELGWSPPAHRIDAPSARRGVLWQHERIRDLLNRARDIAEAALDGLPPAPDAVASAVGDLRAILEVHLVFEEKVLIPILRDDPPLGPERAALMLEEHKRQRELLTGLHQEACTLPYSPLLAAKLASLTAWLLDDMAEEERSLLVPEVIRDDQIVVDQTCG